jgi:hypothetical protein
MRASSAKRRSRPAAVSLVVLAGMLAMGSSARAGALLAKDEALARAFPGATVETKTAFLTEAQCAAVRERTGREPSSKLFTYYEARRDDHVVGRAAIATHVVRTLPEAFLVVLTPDAKIDRVLMLAFYEPPEYRPPDRWLEQFAGRRGDDGVGWRVGREVHGLTGATLTSHAVTGAIREILAIFEALQGTERP